jgi:5-methyltetrahydropteroyltriglutamate--homocysteine methyltransferase
MFDQLIPATLVGSYPQPSWLVNKDVLLGSGPPRVRMREVWRPKDALLEEAQDDATLAALHDQERAGIDIVTHGEVRRESYFNHFANALGGIDLDEPGIVPGRSGKPTLAPWVISPIQRIRPVQARDVAFLRAHTDKPIKVAIIMAYAAVLNQEVHEMKDAGADVIQIDEPHMQAHPIEASQFGIVAIDKALDGIEGPTVVHVCFGYAYVVQEKPSGYSFLPEFDACCASAISIETAQPKLDPLILERLPSKKILFGAINLGTEEVETAETVAQRLRGALRHISADRLIAAPVCGMKHLPRDVAFGKLKALVGGATIVRRENQ